MPTTDEQPLYAALTEPQVAALREKHGAVERLYNEYCFVWIKRPDRAAYRAYQNDRTDPTRRLIANEQLLRSVLVYPESAQLDALLNKYPAAADDLADPLLEICGVTNRASHSKS